MPNTNDRATVKDRSGEIQHFIGAQFYDLRSNWIGRVEVLANGIEVVGIFFRPISAATGTTTNEHREIIAKQRAEQAALEGR